MLKIRLRRIGAIRQPHYRIVVADARSPRDGRFIEILGHYNPLTDPATIQIDVAKYEDWKRKGAQPTDSVAGLVRQFNRTARAAASATEAAPAPVSSTRTRTASGKGMSKAEQATEAARLDAPGLDAPGLDAPMNEAMAEGTRDGGESAEAMSGVAADVTPDTTDAPAPGETAGAESASSGA